MKTIIFCADGTWNGPSDDEDRDGVPDITNVLKTFLCLEGNETLHDWRKQNEQERELFDKDGKLIQIAKYLHGVGDSSNPLVRALGGIFGSGVIARIVRGYTFISRNYEPGDKIVLIGFSRGAYTARALGGMIAAQGLLNAVQHDLSNKEQAYRLGASVWQQYRHASLRRQRHALGLFALFEQLVDALPRFASKRLDKQDLTVVPEIHAIAVWDTVGSLGIPQYDEQDVRVDTFRFADNILSPKVKHGFHAISVDECRKDFAPSLWETDKRIKQVLFPGAHADVGGGYPAKNKESGLSDISLDWMVRELRRVGVRFSPTPQIAREPDYAGCAHLPWTSGFFKAFPPRPRAFEPGLLLHEAVTRRYRAGEVPYEDGSNGPYRPNNLVHYVDAGGNLLDKVKLEPLELVA